MLKVHSRVVHGCRTWNKIFGESPIQITQRRRPLNSFIYHSHDNDTVLPEFELSTNVICCYRKTER